VLVVALASVALAQPSSSSLLGKPIPSPDMSWRGMAIRCAVAR
jgi:hypothetical protein